MTKEIKANTVQWVKVDSLKTLALNQQRLCFHICKVDRVTVVPHFQLPRATDDLESKQIFGNGNITLKVENIWTC